MPTHPSSSPDPDELGRLWLFFEWAVGLIAIAIGGLWQYFRSSKAAIWERLNKITDGEGERAQDPERRFITQGDLDREIGALKQYMVDLQQSTLVQVRLIVIQAVQDAMHPYRRELPNAER